MGEDLYGGWPQLESGRFVVAHFEDDAFVVELTLAVGGTKIIADVFKRNQPDHPVMRHRDLDFEAFMIDASELVASVLYHRADAHSAPMPTQGA